jgi:hypothetical protein
MPERAEVSCCRASTRRSASERPVCSGVSPATALVPHVVRRAVHPLPGGRGVDIRVTVVRQ